MDCWCMKWNGEGGDGDGDACRFLFGNAYTYDLGGGAPRARAPIERRGRCSSEPRSPPRELSSLPVPVRCWCRLGSASGTVSCTAFCRRPRLPRRRRCSRRPCRRCPSRPS
uniref:Uncharacterized protein n=1 Tax=Arundo donax TaxID=35708 RepID=A0A0A9DW41_ARUDO